MKQPQPLGPGPIVDAPELRPRRQQYGYIVRWRARQQFLDAATELVPRLLPTLLTDGAINLASENAEWHNPVMYPVGQETFGSLLERLLFSRDDGLFFGVDWTDFDPQQDSRLGRLRDMEQAFLRDVGREGIAQAWGARRAERINLGMPVWQNLTLFSQSESDGDTEREWLRSVSPSLWHLISTWTQGWHLSRPWAFMVAIATVCDAARRTSDGDLPPLEFTVPNRWEPWYVDQIGTFAGPEPAKRPQRRRSAQGNHMVWLVQRHFMRRAASDIASANGVSQEAVDKKTRQLAELVGLDLQLAGVGRPRRLTAHTIKVAPKEN